MSPLIVQTVQRGALTLALLVPALTANASTVSGTIRFFDQRSQRDDDTGSRLTSGNVNTNRNLRSRIELWDQDGNCRDFASGCNETDDDLLAGNILTNASGQYSVSGIGSLEDVYIRFEYSGVYGIVRGGSATYSALSNTVVDIGGNIVINWNPSCPHISSGLCTTANINPVTSAAANMQASMNDVYGWSSVGVNNYLTGYWPSGPNGECAGTNPPAGQTFDASSFCIHANFAQNPHTVGHEIGHSKHMATLGTTAINPPGQPCADIWNGVNFASDQACTVGEGYANFYALTAFYQPTATDPDFVGFDVESGGCVSPSSSPHGRIGNVTRFFWDLWDPISGNDTVSWNLWDIHAPWGDFGSGTGDRKRNEPNSTDNGRNVYDYVFHAATASDDLCAEVDLNCLSDQDQGSTTVCP